MSEVSQENPKAVLGLRVSVFLSFFTAAVSVLTAFINLITYLAFVLGKVVEEDQPLLFQRLQDIQQSPYSFLIMNLYNIVLWNAVIICTIWLLRYHEWARRALKGLLGFDLVFTVFHLLWLTYMSDESVSNPSWYILLNVMQVAAIILLSHPAVVELTVHQTSRRNKLMNEDEK